MSTLFVPHPPGFRPRRGLNWFIIGLLYASYYMCRYNFRFATPGLVHDYGFTTFQITGILSASSIAYGTGQLVNGLLTDRIGGKTSMLIGAAGTITINLIFGFASFAGTFATFAAIWWHERLRAVIWDAGNGEDKRSVVPADRARHVRRHLRLHDSDRADSASTISRP